MTPDLCGMPGHELRILVRQLREKARQGNLTRAASSHSLNKILGELRQAEECADRLRTQRDRAVNQYEDTHKDLLIVESQVTAFGLRVEEGEAKYRLLSKQWSSLLRHKNYAEREVDQLKSEAVSNRAHISSHMGRAEGGSQCVQQLRTQVEALKEERDKAEAKEYAGGLSTIKADQAMRIVRDERDDLRARLNASIEQVNRTGHQRSLDEACLAASRQSVQKRFEKIRELEGALACKERRIDNLEEDRIHYLDNVAEKNKRISELVTELDGARKALRSKGTAALYTENVVLLHEKDALLAKKHKLGQQLQLADRQDDRRCMRIAYLQEAGEQLASDLATTQAKVRVLEHRLGRLTSGETLAALGISDLEHKEQITRLEEEIRLVRTENLDLLNRLGKRRIALSYKNERIIKLRKKLREGSPDRIRALTEGLASTKEQLKTVTEAYHALHLKTEAITTFVPAVPMHTGGQSRFPGGPLRCVYCRKEFTTFQDAKDKEQHEMDCHWVELEEVALWTEQDVLRVAAGETG